ncbi:hypothetical protein CSA56_19125 [candidate division KSB3 bacterium]|uniref:AB hydrolase-1 domain-containing protein n=1 Tax=candidate division KSB3 bacterium TaxID=2044937 RepID=A0A2G6K646_9BACT|nr:MAG: hypothetical protein CSA56_19125 [candidate division KSB3 bacterium]
MKTSPHHCLCLFILFLAYFPVPSRLSAQDLELSMQEISYPAKDGVTISASWVVPKNENSGKEAAKFPVIILLHDYGLNRRDWGIMIPDFVQQGFGVLVPDLRGHGQSRDTGASSPPSIEEILKTGVVDVEAALKWIKFQKKADAKRVALVGVGVGGDITYLCSGVLKKKIRTSVVISPSDTLVSGGEFINFNAQGILFLASLTSRGGLGMIAAETLEKFTKDPKKLLPYTGDAHGFALFYKHPQIKRAILDWLSFLKHA